MPSGMGALAYAEDAIIDSARDRVAALEVLVDRFAAYDEEGPRREFSRLFADAALILEMSDIDLARLFKISRPTVGRWGRGESAPHPLGRRSVFDVLAREAKKKLRTIGGRVDSGMLCAADPAHSQSRFAHDFSDN